MTETSSLVDNASITFTSAVLSGYRGEEINYHDWSDEKLIGAMNEAVRTIKILIIENEVFENFLMKKDPEILAKLPQVMHLARLAVTMPFMMKKSGDKSANMSSSYNASSRPGSLSMDLKTSLGSISSLGDSSLSASQVGPGGIGRKSTKATVRNLKGMKLTLNHRIDLVKKETTRMQKRYKNYEKQTLKEKDKLSIEYDEIKQRTSEAIDSLASFERDVVRVADPETRKVPIDIFMKYFDNQLRLLNRRSDKLNLFIISTKRQIKETKKLKLQQESVGGNLLRPIDFKKLMIENEYLIKETEENNQTLTGLKKICGFYNLTLKNVKVTLIDKKLKLQATENEFQKEKKKKATIRRSQIVTAREVEEVQSQLNHIKKLYDEYDYPEVSDFLEVQRQLQEVKKDYKKLWRQRNIQRFTRSPVKKQETTNN